MLVSSLLIIVEMGLCKPRTGQVSRHFGPRHFRTVRLVPKYPDSSAPVPKCFADTSALVVNCIILQQTFLQTSQLSSVPIHTAIFLDFSLSTVTSQLQDGPNSSCQITKGCLAPNLSADQPSFMIWI